MKRLEEMSLSAKLAVSGAILGSVGALAACSSGAGVSVKSSPASRASGTRPAASASAFPRPSTSPSEALPFRAHAFAPTSAEKKAFGPAFTGLLTDIGALGVKTSEFPATVKHHEVVNANGTVGNQWNFASDGQTEEITVFDTTSSDGEVGEDVYTSASAGGVEQTSGSYVLPAEDELSFSEQVGTGVPNEITVKLSGPGVDTPSFTVVPGEVLTQQQALEVHTAVLAMNAIANQTTHPIRIAA